MGSSISVDLEWECVPPINPKVFKGTLIMINKSKKTKVFRRRPFPRVQLQWRARCVYQKGRQGEEEWQHVFWTAGEDLVGESGEWSLEPGVNKFPFSFDVPPSELVHPEQLYKKRGKDPFTYMQFNHIVRGGCPPLTKDIQCFPKLLSDPDVYEMEFELGKKNFLDSLLRGTAVAGTAVGVATSLAGL